MTSIQGLVTWSTVLMTTFDLWAPVVFSRFYLYSHLLDTYLSLVDVLYPAMIPLYLTLLPVLP